MHLKTFLLSLLLAAFVAPHHLMAAPRVAWDLRLPGDAISQIVADGEGGVVVRMDANEAGTLVWLTASGRIRFQGPANDLRSVSPKGITFIDSSALLWAVDRQGRQVRVPDSAGVLPIYPPLTPGIADQIYDRDGFFVFQTENGNTFLRRYEW